MYIVDVFAVALGLKYNNGGVESIDVAWQLQRKIDEIEKEEKEDYGTESLPATGV
jgi:hypothetical protein